MFLLHMPCIINMNSGSKLHLPLWLSCLSVDGWIAREIGGPVAIRVVQGGQRVD